MEYCEVKEVIVWMLLSSEQSNSKDIGVRITNSTSAWPQEREQGAEK
jgi:hypothetical protein